MKGKVYVKEGASLIGKLKAKGIAYEIDGRPEIKKLTTNVGTNRVITLNIEATDDVGIVAWGICIKGSENIQWKEVTSTKKLSTTYKDFKQNGTYEVKIKDTVGNIESKEIKITELDTTIAEVTEIKIVSPTSGEYKPGQKIVIRVQFSEKVKGTAPTLKLKIGDEIVTATGTNPAGTQDYIEYTYTTTDNNTGKVETYSYSGGDLTDVAGNKVTIAKLENSGNTITIKPNEVNMATWETRVFSANWYGKTKTFGYWIYIPELSLVGTYKNIPLVVYLHGDSKSGSNINIVQTSSLPRFIREGKIKPKAIVIAPQTPQQTNGESFDHNPEVIMTLIELIKKQYDINENKISITGHSLGGNGTWNVAKAYPNVFSCCVPVSLWVHGSLGEVSEMPNCRTRFIYESSGYDTAKERTLSYRNKLIKNKGSKYGNIFTMEIIKWTDHGSVVRVYEDKDLNLVEWMISQTRGKLY